MMNELLQDLRFGCRTLIKSPGFTITAILILAIAIGANTAIFSLVDGILLKPLPYDDPDGIVRVMEKPPLPDPAARNGISTLNYLDWQKQNTVFQYMAAVRFDNVTLTGVAEPQQLRGARVSAHYFDIFHIRPAMGRTFVEGEDQLGKENVVVLSYALWQTQFGSDRTLVGRTIRLDGEPHTVIGVLPPGSAFDRTFFQMWRPLVFLPANMTRNFHWFGSLARLKPGVTLKQAQAQMNTIGARIAHDYPDSNKGWGVAVDRYAEVLAAPQLRQSLYVLLAAVAMVLLIGCANLANLTLARCTVREREVAIRSSLGAGRGRLVRQFLTENVLLAVCGGLFGLVVGYLTIGGLKLALPPNALPAEADVRLDGRVLLFSLALSVLTGILFGLAPATQATKPNLAGAMKEGGRGTTGARHRLRSALVVADVALAFVLLVGAGLLIRSFFRMQDAENGFDSTNVITANLPIADKQFPDPAQLNAYLREIDLNIEAIPGVRDVANTSALPMRGWGYGMPFQVAHHPLVDRANRQACFFKMVSPNYLRTLGIPLRKGRGLNDHDIKGSPPVTVINETMARKFFPNEDPIGKRILIQAIVPGQTQLGQEIGWEVVGIAADERVTNIDNPRDNPGVYVTNEQSPVYFQGLVVRAAMDPTRLQTAIVKAIHSVNKDQSVAEIKTLEQIKTESLASNRLRVVLLSVFGGIAVLLSSIGTYGVVSYSVAQRTNEIGIRAALGASSGRLLGMVLRSGMLLTALGLAIGLGGALGLTRLLTILLFGVQARDPITIAAVAAILGLVALAACYIPARRAARVDPVIALRCE